MVPEDVSALNPGTCDHVNLHSKRDLGNVIMVCSLKWDNYWSKHNLITRALKSREQLSAGRKKRNTSKRVTEILS